ncbi:hypothetical protein BDV37DRAFT_275917 [Aspergillus pseudonomiae]|uniref:Uncharacterized protein n=1 Tax=Aspergillus pseudonomiae TaxID=1506151 RepID=A0A5N7CX05_9EURO|nr:uncharacterized protein BDV37DRAFT_275917 [Aspergillus pseudonomiae]KAE8398691.1 hypothetical protein BDV37DRAFT_275917 [Aspergillus pseudonomiae]
MCSQYFYKYDCGCTHPEGDVVYCAKRGTSCTGSSLCQYYSATARAILLEFCIFETLRCIQANHFGDYESLIGN